MRLLFKTYQSEYTKLRTFARKCSNIDFLLKLLLQLGYELLLSEMKKKLGGHQLRFGDKISERPP